MNARTKIGLLWLLSCALAGALGWYGRSRWLRTTPADSGRPPLFHAVQLSAQKEIHVADADGQMLLVAMPGASARTLQSLHAYSEESGVFYTNHHDDGTIKEIGVNFGGKIRYAWTFRPDGSLETSTTYDARGRGIVRFFDESGKPTGKIAQTWLRCVD